MANYDIDAVARITAVHDDPRPYGHTVCRECGYGWPCEKYLLAQDVIEARAAIARVRALCDEAGSLAFTGVTEGGWLHYEAVEAALDGDN